MDEITQLSNPPLVEVIFELRWELFDKENGIPRDPNNKILPGMLFYKLKKDYHHFEQLPTINMPEEISGGVVQHQFRIEKGKWPLVQIGHGIVTLNDLKEYTWNDFEPRIKDLVLALYEIYPEKEKFKPISLILRYIDSYPFDFTNDDVLQFIENHLKVNSNIPKNILSEFDIRNNTQEIDLRYSFKLNAIDSELIARFFKGNVNNIESLMWETIIIIKETNVPQTTDEIMKWVDQSHKITHKWFFELVKGKLLEEFL